jgi:predicted Rossmann fold flavoprotein
VRYDAIVLGGGAAGLFCAAIAGQRGRRIVVLERSHEPGRKILISGGGRCNFTNLHCRPDHFLSNNPAFARSALARHQPSDFIALVERYGIAYHEKTLGQLFCDGSSRQIVDLLIEECRAAGVELLTGCDISVVREGFVVETSRGGCRDWRPVDSEDRRDRSRLSRRAAVRRQRRGAASCPCAAPV